jgi:hypothetical protein
MSGNIWRLLGFEKRDSCLTTTRIITQARLCLWDLDAEDITHYISELPNVAV